MHPTPLEILLLFTIIVWILRIMQNRCRNLAGLPLPPGPIRLPLLGNIFNFPKTDSWLVAARWRKTYGEY
jgi:hypothetical protein